MPYAIDYIGITAIGLPFYVLSTGGNHLIRADRSPTYSMACILAGAAINTILDPLFIFGFGWGIKGAAWATVIGQIVSGLLIIFYFSRLRKMYLDHSMLIPKARNLSAIFFSGNGILYQSGCHCCSADRHEQYTSPLRSTLRLRE